MFDPPIKADFLAHGLVACPVPDEDLECPIYREQFISALSTPSDTTESDSTTSLVDSATDEYTTPPPERPRNPPTHTDPRLQQHLLSPLHHLMA